MDGRRRAVRRRRSSPRPPGARPALARRRRARRQRPARHAPRPPTSSWSRSTSRRDEWPERLRGLSGYLVPKPVQRSVTAVSFGSQKWAHWRPPDGGRDPAGVGGSRRHVAARPRPTTTSSPRCSTTCDTISASRSPRSRSAITRWPGAFAQYRPHHHALGRGRRACVADRACYVAGSSYRGIGIPACVRDGGRSPRRGDRSPT